MRRLVCLIPLLLLLLSCQTQMPHAEVAPETSNYSAGAYGFNQEMNGLPQFNHKIGPGPDFRR